MSFYDVYFAAGPIMKKIGISHLALRCTTRQVNGQLIFGAHLDFLLRYSGKGDFPHQECCSLMSLQADYKMPIYVEMECHLCLDFIAINTN